MLVVVGRAGLPQILEYPRLFFPRHDARLGGDSSQAAEGSESIVGPRASSKEYRGIGIWGFRHDALDVPMHGLVYGSVERFVGFHATVE